MSQTHFDVAILGEGLGSRIAGALLAKSGLKVLTFAEEGNSLPPWIQVSLHLERILERLDGQSCLSAPEHFQLLTDKTRIDFHGSSILEEELRREFPSGHRNISDFLDHLKSLGYLIEKALLENGGFPLKGIKSRFHFLFKRVRHRLFGRRFSSPLHESFRDDFSRDELDILSALFSGLSLTSFDRLSVAECALLWGAASHSKGICVASLDDLLQRRYGQFHGSIESLKRINSVRNTRVDLFTFNLDNGHTCTATTCLLGSEEGRDHFSKLTHKKLPLPLPTNKFTTTPLGYKISPLLAEHIITSKPTPIRISLTGEGSNLNALVDLPPDTSSNEDIKHTLKDIFPFTALELAPFSPTPGADKLDTHPPASAHFSAAMRNIKTSRNLYFSIGSSLFPSLGPVGEVLTAYSIASDIVSRTKKGK